MLVFCERERDKRRRETRARLSDRLQKTVDHVTLRDKFGVVGKRAVLTVTDEVSPRVANVAGHDSAAYHEVLVLELGLVEHRKEAAEC